MYYDVIVLSGGFDPMHIGHLRMIQESAKMAEIVIVGVNSDEWLMRKKGYVFMPWEERCEIIQAMEGVTSVIPVDDSDETVCAALRKVKPAYFANGGDRKSDNTPEVQVCKELDIEMLWNIGGGKIQSSSDLVNNQKQYANK